MGVFDQASRYLARLEPAEQLAWLIPSFFVAYRFEGWCDATLPSYPGDPDRICDTIAVFTLADSDERWLVDVEFQTEPDHDILERSGEYAYRLRRVVRHGPGAAGKPRVLTVLVSLTGPAQPAVLEMTTPLLDGAGIRQQVVVRTLRDEDAAATLGVITSGRLGRSVLPWIVLMRGADDPGLIARWRTFAESEADPRRRADWGGLALVLSDLVPWREAWQRGLEGYNVQQSPTVLEWQAQARAEGVALGRAEGETMGSVRKQRDLLLRVLVMRFSQVPQALKEAVEQCDDPLRLDQWFEAAIVAADLDAVRGIFSQP